MVLVYDEWSGRYDCLDLTEEELRSRVDTINQKCRDQGYLTTKDYYGILVGTEHLWYRDDWCCGEIGFLRKDDKELISVEPGILKGVRTDQMCLIYALRVN